MTRKSGVIAPLLLIAAGALAVAIKGQEAAKPAKPLQGRGAGKDTTAKGKRPEKSVSVNAVFAGDTKFWTRRRWPVRILRGTNYRMLCRADEEGQCHSGGGGIFKQLGEPGFVRDFKAAGPVDIAYVFYPYRANENQSCLIVNGEPSPIDVDNHKVVATDALKGNAAYAALARTHKEVSLWPGDRYSTETPDVEMGVNAGAHIIVNYRLREQCHACAVLGHGWYSFEFDSTWEIGGAKLLGVSVAREPGQAVVGHRTAR